MDGQELTRRMREALESVIGIISIEITDGTTYEQLGMDYIDEIEYEIALEEEFNIDIENEQEVYEANTFGELKAIVQRKLKEDGR